MAAFIIILCGFLSLIPETGGNVVYRYHPNASSRNILIRTPGEITEESKEFDTITVDNFLRGYLKGPINDELAFFKHDLVSAYVGPMPKHDQLEHFFRPSAGKYDLKIRAWAMIDLLWEHVCDLNAIHNWGELALFVCPVPGVYRAFALEYSIVKNDQTEKDRKINGEKEKIMDPKLLASKEVNLTTMQWLSTQQKEPFDLMLGTTKDLTSTVLGFKEGDDMSQKSRIAKLKEKMKTFDKISVSDPMVFKNSYYCYYWMFSLNIKGRVGYHGQELLPPPASVNESSYMLLEMHIWVAEPSAMSLQETEARVGSLQISEYSKVITNRFHDTGLVPCYRKANRIIEVVSEMTYVSEIDPSNPLKGAPHWRSIVKVHTDRLISTLSDITFTIASRQNTGSFHCFVGETKVQLNARHFDFVRQSKLERGAINMELSEIWYLSKGQFRHQLKHVYGHGVQFIGHKHQKHLQPATKRKDVHIVSNPCIAQEFAISASGSLYVAQGFLRAGIRETARVVLPDFGAKHASDTDPNRFRDYLRIYDVYFTPTHFVILMSDGDIILHATSIKLKGMGRFRGTQKHRLSSIVKRKWCPRTSTPKLSAMLIPMFGRDGTIIILHVTSIEGSVRMWLTQSAGECVPESAPIVAKARQIKYTLLANTRDDILNETDIHYNELTKITKTNQKTGLEETPPEPRPEPPPPSIENLEQRTEYLLNAGTGTLIEEGKDPHYPPNVLDPARHVIGSNMTDFNKAVLYSLTTQENHFDKLITNNGINEETKSDDDKGHGLYVVEFGAVEKQFIAAYKFVAKEIPSEFAEKDGIQSFQMIVTTVTVTNLPFRVALAKDVKVEDEKLETIIPFPGTILVRSKSFRLPIVTSNDPLEEEEHKAYQNGDTDTEYTPEVAIMNTAIPSYVINFGDILVYTSLESRYARPLHFYEWSVIDKQARTELDSNKKVPLKFDQSSIKFNKEIRQPGSNKKKNKLYDIIVTEQGITSVLWRKLERYTVIDFENSEKPLQENENNLFGTYTQTVAMGSVISLEGLREVNPFYRFDNVFQRLTPDGEIVYGTYNMKEYTPFSSCDSAAGSDEACIDQGPAETNSTDSENKKVCSRDVPPPCTSAFKLEKCSENGTTTEPCLRFNKVIPHYNTSMAGRDDMSDDMKSIWPLHAPYEDLRSVNFLAVSFVSFLLGSLQSVKSLHPEAPDITPENEDDADERNQDPDICPFSSFKVYYVSFDYAEVGYQTRITGEISYFGTGIPTEADLIVEFETIMGVIVEVSSSVEEQRGLTTIKKTIDISFRMTDFLLGEIFDQEKDRKALEREFKTFDFDALRAREKSSVFSLTVRPSIVNNHCKSVDYFKTVQFNVGCNTFSTIRLIDQASPFVRANWDELSDVNKKGLNWIRDKTVLRVPKTHVYHKQVNTVFNCTPKFENDPQPCVFPYFNLYGDNVFTVSYRDLFYPKFEQFTTVSTRPVTANMIIYDIMGSTDFNLTINKLQAGCHNTGNRWYEQLVNSTHYINTGSSEHENVYKYFQDCFDSSGAKSREHSHHLSSVFFHLHNLTNNNKIKFKRQRNQILIFRAFVMNTEYNRFTYCKTLETFFLVRVMGIPIPRQGLKLWNYLLIIFLVMIGLLVSYFIFFYFYTWKLDSIGSTDPSKEPTAETDKTK